MSTSDKAITIGQATAKKLFDKRGTRVEIHVDQIDLTAMLALAYDEGSKAAATTARVPPSDLAAARKAYFDLGGIESDIGPRDDAGWYWRRAFKLARNKLEVVEAKLAK